MCSLYVREVGRGVKAPGRDESALDGKAAEQALQRLIDEEGDNRA